MPELTLIYFDFDGGRGEPARLALRVAGVPFEDRRITPRDWPAMRSSTPFGGLPVLVVGEREVCQSNAINRYVGRLTGLYPQDPWRAAECDEIMDAAEHLGEKVIQTMSIADADARRRAREDMSAELIPFYLERLQRRLEQRGGEWFVEERLTMADLRVFVLVSSLLRGSIDHVPIDLVQRVAPALAAHHERVAAVPQISAYRARRR